MLGPLYFLLYTSEILALVKEFGFRVHGYADDLQIYDQVDQRQSSDVIVRFSQCVDAIKDWMARNRLHLNPSLDGNHMARICKVCTEASFEGAGASPPPKEKEKEKEKKEKKENKKKKEEQKQRKKKGNYKKRQITTYKVLFF